ncbi:hypothetical protein PAXRUDRAFT_823483 [Paxillus rubicundulus Ve08.2h10]|uniref:Uncharacterized protein n=1 Tax=Paxillus rubicundulus Ve08.2h10 TaxID=930991 RepID=A0A0D0EC62_9AGAM|nr:hypothetical protein PAXRUDRAFT_823483 [Paxillus rubicundulus Ve08.2h10]
MAMKKCRQDAERPLYAQVTCGSNKVEPPTPHLFYPFATNPAWGSHSHTVVAMT